MRPALSASALTLASLLLASPALAQDDIDLKLARFFGVCDTKSSDIDAAVGEACIIEAIIRSFSEADNGITVTQLPTDWDSYYDQIKTSMVGGNAPDVFVMHKHRVPEFASIGALAEITEEEYKEAGIPFDDFTDLAVEGVTYEGKHYGVPFDFHAYLWHINMGLMAEAGLVNEDGTPKLPSSPEEMLEHARQMKERTGADYLTSFFTEGPQNMRLFTALMAQQGVDPYNEEGVNLDSEAARNAINAFAALDQEGLIDVTVPELSVRNHWFSGNAAILIDGTWRVDANDAAIRSGNVAVEEYYVSEHPQLFSQGGAWADTHMWAIPSTVKQNDHDKFMAALELLAYISEHNIDWARTGHLPVRASVLESEELASLPHRSEYAKTAEIAYYLQPAKKYGAIQDAIGRHLVTFYQNDRPLDEVLADMQFDVEEALD